MINAPPPTGNAENRLQQLKELHEQGLLTDEEYKQKRDAILSEL